MSDGNLTTCDGNWSELPPEILEQILRRLTFPDTRRFSAVCSQWRSILKSEPPAFGFGSIPIPWLMVGDEAIGSGLPKRARRIGGRIRRFFNPVERRCYDIEAAEFARSVCHAAVRDWLLLSVCREGKEESWEVLFLNPFTKERFNLPGAHSPFDLGVCSGVPTCTDCVVLLLTKGVAQLQTTLLKLVPLGFGSSMVFALVSTL